MLHSPIESAARSSQSNTQEITFEIGRLLSKGVKLILSLAAFAAAGLFK